MCATSLVAPGFSVAASSTAAARGQVLQALPPLFPVLRPLCVTVHPPLDVQVYGVLLVCWAEVSMLNCGCLMVVRCRGETKKASVFALMLMLFHSVHFKNIYWKTIYIKRSDQITHLH